jgi:type IV secretory pathway TraG/TraD family ATPase VirD4
MDNIGIYLHPQIAITKSQEVGNLLIFGAQGSGKSTILKDILSQILARGDRTLIYDAKREYTELFYSKNNLLLSPTDKRSLMWDIASDVTSPEVAYQIACIFVTQHGKDPIWANGARSFLAGCMIILMKSFANWSWPELKAMIDRPVAELKPLFLKYYPEAAKLIEENSATTASFTMELITHLNWLNYVAQVWSTDSKNKISISKWIAGGYSFKSLIIQNDPKLTKIAAPLCTSILSIIVNETLSLPDDKSRRFWFILDELTDLPKNEYLAKWLSLGRSKGARTIAGTQNASQLIDLYGFHMSESLTSLFSNFISLKVGTSFETAKKASDNFGKRRVKRASTQFDQSGNRSTSYSVSEEYIIQPDRLIQLPTPDNKGVVGYLSIGGWDAVYELKWPYPKLQKKAKHHEPIVFNNIKLVDETNKSRRGIRGRSRDA